MALLSAAAAGQQLNMREYGQEQGLANLVAQSMFQDREGFLWVGTQSGLFRYDGFRFRGYFSDSGLPSTWIGGIHESADGALWVATRTGLVRRVGDRFEAVAGAGGYEILGHDALASDSEGTVYAATSRGVLVVRSGPSGGQPTGRFENWGIDLGRVYALQLDPAGALWLTCRGRILKVDLRSARPAVVSYGPAQGIADVLWTAVLTDRQGNVWARSPEHLVMLPPGARRFVPMDRGVPPSTYDNGVLQLDSRGRLVIPTDLGLAIREGDGWDRIDSRRGLPVNSVTSFLEDREGSIWIGLSGAGIVRWVGAGRWEAWTTTEGLSNMAVWSVRRDTAGTLWAGTDYGLDYLPRGNAIWKGWRGDGLDRTTVRALEVDHDGSLWMSTGRGEVAHLNLRTGRATRFGVDSGLGNDKIMNMTIDAEGRVWVATRAGLYRSTRQGGKVHFEQQSPPGGEPRESFTQVVRGRNADIWAGGNAGLVHFQGGRWTRFTTHDGLRNNRVSYVTHAADGAVWVAYREDFGVSKLVFRDGRTEVQNFGMANGLASNHGVFIREDPSGRIWFGSDNGVDVFEGGVWRHYGRGDGLVWDDCDADSFLADDDGAVWIGTSRGISRFRPPERDVSAQPTPATIASATFGNHAVAAENAAGVPFKERSLRLRFTSLTFLNEDAVRFRYRLLDLQKDWVETRLREVEFPGLAPGWYTFEVVARNSHGLWSDSPARYSFQILPPWWKTWWFETTLIALAAACSWLLWCARERRLLRQRQRLEEAVAARTAELVREKAVIDRQNREIELLLHQTQQASRAKSAFLANMSHEIRTPLNGVSGMLDVIRETGLTPEQAEYVDIATDSAAALLCVLNDVLDLSRIEAGRIELTLEPLSVRGLVAECARLVELQAKQKQLDVSWSVDDAVPEMLIGDVVRLRQILLNLLGNAIKFTHEGQIGIRVAPQPMQGATAGVMLRWTVADTGIGIPVEKHQVIFEAFQQADSSTTRKYGGSGLGLAICARLAEVMGGRIWVESHTGKGSVFHFTTLLQPCHTRPAPTPSMTLPSAPDIEAHDGSPRRALTVLVAEDNPVNQKVVVRLLEKRGHSVAVAAHGREAVAMAASRPFDVILMDVHMPEMDGFEATRLIREQQRHSSTFVPIIALTACAMTGDREKCLKAGMDGYVDKPVDRAKLIHAVENAADAALEAPAAADP